MIGEQKSLAPAAALRQKLTMDQRNVVRQRLVELFRDEVQVSAADRDGFVENGSVLGETFDSEAYERGTDEHILSLSQMRLSRGNGQLKEITEALERMKRNWLNFDECIDCGSHIGMSRFDAKPTVCRCVTCEDKQERKSSQRRVISGAKNRKCK